MQSKDELIEELRAKVYLLGMKCERQQIEIEKFMALVEPSYSPLLAQYGIGDELPETD